MSSTSDKLHVRLQKKLDIRRSEHRYRSLDPIDVKESSRTVRIQNREYLNFSSNDYLNLSNHPHLREKSNEYTERYGTGSSSSRLVTGTLDIHRKLENRIAEMYRKEEALLFSSGFQANSTILPAVTGKKDAIIADELCHNSIITGCLASQAHFYRFRHNNLTHLEEFLKKKSEEDIRTIWIVTESLFSMDGDRAPLAEMIQLASSYNAKLYVDDAHALGVYGENGLGFGADYPEIDVLLSTFGKAAGSFGAFVTSSEVLINSLINYCNGFIYTTALPPSVVGSVEAALDLIPKMDSERTALHNLSEYLHSKILEKGWNTSDRPSHIIPIIYGEEEKVLKRSRDLRDKGIIATAIRPPTVPQNECRFRISLTSAHTRNDCDKLLGILA